MVMLFWVATLQINLNGQLLSAILSWPVSLATWWAVGLVLFYVLVGGYWTVIRTDVFQACILALMVFVPATVSPRPDLELALSAPVAWKDLSLIFAMSFSLTLVRPELWQRTNIPTNYGWKVTPLTIATAMMAAATQSMVMQNGGHHRVLAT